MYRTRFLGHMLLFDGSDLVRPEVWLRYTGISAWNDVQAWGPTRGDERWDATDPLFIDQTVGFKNTSRIGGGVRATFFVDAVEITPVVTVDYASGRTFGDFNLNNDTDIDLVARAEDDLFRVSSLDLMAGVGVTWRPFEEMRVIASVSGDLSRVSTTFDNLASYDGEIGNRAAIHETFWTVPVISIGAEYYPFEVFGIRGSVRGSALLSRDGTQAEAFVGDPAGDDPFDATIQTLSTRGSTDTGVVPNLAAAIGPTLRFENVQLDAVFGGLFIGGQDVSLFGRLDLKVDWN